MSEFASDAHQFIMIFFEPISVSTPHIYISALPFAPQNSQISMHFIKYFAKTLKIKKGQMKYRSERCVLRIKGGSLSVAYSPDGRHIVSGSHEGDVQVWDAQTGHSVMDLVYFTLPHTLQLDSTWTLPESRWTPFSPGGVYLEYNQMYIFWIIKLESIQSPSRVHLESAYTPDGLHPNPTELKPRKSEQIELKCIL